MTVGFFIRLDLDPKLETLDDLEAMLGLDTTLVLEVLIFDGMVGSLIAFDGTPTGLAATGVDFDNIGGRTFFMVKGVLVLIGGKTGFDTKLGLLALALASDSFVAFASCFASAFSVVFGGLYFLSGMFQISLISCANVLFLYAAGGAS